MNLLKLASLFAALATTSFTAGIAPAQEKSPKPGPEHELLRQFVGDWKVRAKVQNPDGTIAIKFAAEYTAKMDVGGFFLFTEFTTKLGGNPFKGRGVTSYDPHKKTYVGIWMESNNPVMFNSRGKCDKTGKVFSEIMEGSTPKGKPVKSRVVTRFASADRRITTIYMRGPDGKETKTVEFAFTRKK